jgi:hypothetical protein
LLFDKSVLNTSPATGPLGTRLEENTPSGSIDVPLLVAQGETDNLILPTMQAEYVQQRCDRGGDVDYRTYPGRDHVGLVADDSPLIPDLVQWTQDRLDSRPATSSIGCPSIRGYRHGESGWVRTPLRPAANSSWRPRMIRCSAAGLGGARDVAGATIDSLRRQTPPHGKPAGGLGHLRRQEGADRGSRITTAVSDDRSAA